jgi:glucose-6-phosphate 1-dehydrogenase
VHNGTRDIALRAWAKRPGEPMAGEAVRLVEHYHPTDEMEPYERLLGDALRGDRILFGNEEGVEAAWRIVDRVLDDVSPITVYEQRSWGPDEADRLASDVGGWIAPARARRNLGGDRSADISTSSAEYELADKH